MVSRMLPWPRSSIGQSAGLSIRRLWVRAPSGSLNVTPAIASTDVANYLAVNAVLLCQGVTAYRRMLRKYVPDDLIVQFCAAISRSDGRPATSNSIGDIISVSSGGEMVKVDAKPVIAGVPENFRDRSVPCKPEPANHGNALSMTLHARIAAVIRDVRRAQMATGFRQLVGDRLDDCLLVFRNQSASRSTETAKPNNAANGVASPMNASDANGASPENARIVQQTLPRIPRYIGFPRKE